MRSIMLEKRIRQRRWLDFVLRHLRSCAGCGASRWQTNLVCHSCWRVLAGECNRGAKLLQPGYKFPVYSLFTWRPESPPVVRRLAYALKGGWHFSALDQLILTFLGEYLSNQKGRLAYASPAKPQATKILSAPSARLCQVDHGAVIAHAFANKFSASYLPFLRLAAEPTEGIARAQKTKSEAERRERAMQFTDELAVKSPPAPWRFIDDVITSGATAEAAWLAIGKPADFEVWTLICRPKLAGR